MTTSDMTLGVVGLGLIGGSVARGWLERSDGAVVAWTRSAATRKRAADHGVTVAASIADVVDRAEVVVLATPLPALPDTLTEVAALIGDRADPPTITDVGSVKLPLHVLAGEVLSDPSIFVPGHPMAGTEHAGWEHADPDLFATRRWALVVDEPVAMRRWFGVLGVALTLGSAVVPVSAADHDRAVALISHLPHLLAAGLRSLLDAEPDALTATLVAGSFSGATRVTEGSGRTLGAEMAWANRREALTRLDQFMAELARQRAALERCDPEALTGLFPSAALRTGDRSTEPSRLVATRADLLSLGRRGGAVVGPEEAGTVAVRERWSSQGDPPGGNQP